MSRLGELGGWNRWGYPHGVQTPTATATEYDRFVQLLNQPLGLLNRLLGWILCHHGPPLAV